MTYREIYEQFLMKTGINKELILDYRPCMEMFGVPCILDAVVIWIKGDGKIIYIGNEESEGTKSC